LIFQHSAGWCMRSTETSGVGSRRFSRLVAQVSPLTYAVALTAFLAATLFVVVDSMRTLDEVAERGAILARLGAAQPLLGRQFVATAFEPVIDTAETADAMTALAQRGALAYGLAALFGLAAFRRRP